MTYNKIKYWFIPILIFLQLPLVSWTQKADDIKDIIDAPDLSKLKGQLKESIKKYKEAEPLIVNGTFSLNNVLTAMTQGQNPQPYSFVASGNLMLTVKGYKLPFSFTYSNWKFSNSNPSFRFNKFSFQPKIKNLGLTLGTGNMTFSPYTLNGFQFNGIGGEKTFKKFKIQAMVGNFMEAIREDTAGNLTPSFKRWGTGLKVGYTNNNKKLGMSVFYSTDDKNSIPVPEKDENRAIRPKENLAISFDGGFPLAKQLTWEGEIATSVITEDMSINDTYGMSQNPLIKLLKSHNTTTKIYGAMKSNLNYIIGEDGLIGLGYERVQPNYHTLGAYYFTNDFENITINAQHRGKVNIGLNTGMQYDNLNNKKGSSSGRMVVASNLNFKVKENMDFMMTYSNFQSFTFIRTGFERINQATLYENIDTLSFSLLSQNAMMNVNYALTKDTAHPQTLSANLNYMESDNRSRGTTITPQLNNGSKFLNGAVNYSIGFVQKDLTLSAGVNFSHNYGGVFKTTTIGPVLSAAKNLFDKKVNTTAMLAYNLSKSEQISQHILTLNFSANTTLKKQHNLNFNLLGQQRMATKSLPAMIVTTTIGYTYSFERKYKKIPFLKKKTEFSKNSREGSEKETIEETPKE
jgi:hypothetical protein